MTWSAKKRNQSYPQTTLRLHIQLFEFFGDVFVHFAFLEFSDNVCADPRPRASMPRQTPSCLGRPTRPPSSTRLEAQPGEASRRRAPIEQARRKH
jgi:hypothetical protein